MCRDFNCTAFRRDKWLKGKLYLNEADVGGVLSKALAAAIQAIFPNNRLLVSTDSACSRPTRREIIDKRNAPFPIFFRMRIDQRFGTHLCPLRRELSARVRNALVPEPGSQKLAMAPKDYRVVQSFLSSEEVEALSSLIDSVTDWTPGRQGTGYDKFCLRSKEMAPGIAALVDRSKDALQCEIIDWDCYLLRYPDGSFIGPHIDETAGKRHRRLNAVIQAGGGGVLALQGEAVPLAVKDAVVFRPDIIEHSVTPVQGERYVWSVGCVF